jgi:hypothetical protein
LLIDIKQVIMLKVPVVHKMKEDFDKCLVKIINMTENFNKFVFKIFLPSILLAGILVSCTQQSSTAPSAAADEGRLWYEKPFGLVQTNLREDMVGRVLELLHIEWIAMMGRLFQEDE